MKKVKIFLAALVLVGSAAAASPLRAADGVISKEELTPGSYCHMEFPAVEAKSLASDKPVPKDASSGDIIDYYGPCNENPVGQDQAQEQRLDYDHHWITNYLDY